MLKKLIFNNLFFFISKTHLKTVKNCLCPPAGILSLLYHGSLYGTRVLQAYPLILLFIHRKTTDMNISRNLLLLLIGLLMTVSGRAQGFLHTYAPASSSARAVVPTVNGGYFAAGGISSPSTIFLLRTNATGQTLWSNSLSLNQAQGIAACASADSGFVVLAENYLDNGIKRNAVLKLDANGTVQWNTLVPNALLPNGLSDIIAVSDGSYIAAGITRDANFINRNWLVKLAPDGSILWSKAFGVNGQSIKKLVQLSDGNIAVSGHLSDNYLAKLDLNGELLWEKNFPENGNQTNYDLLSTTDGNIALLGSSPDPVAGSLNISILKTNLDGDLLWHKDYYPYPTPFNNPYLPVLNGFTQDGAGNFYIPLWGFQADPNGAPLELLKLSTDGLALWKQPLAVNGNAWRILHTSDDHLIIAGDNEGTPTNALLLKTDLDGNFLSNTISGNVYRDADMDCAFTTGEQGLENMVVKAENVNGEAYYKRTNADGSYQIHVSEGDFKLSVRPSFGPSTFYVQCDTPVVSVTNVNPAVQAPAILEQVTGECPLLNLELSGGILRRCLPTYYHLNWCNTGNLPALNSVLQVIKHPFLIYESSSWPLMAQSGDTLSFFIGLVPPGQCESMNIQFKVDCDAHVADVLCVEASLSPDTSCAPPNLNWDGSQIEVSGECTGAEIEFKIKNTGASDMTQMADYVIIEDEIMYAQPAIQLTAGAEMTTIRFPMPDDSCFALQVFPNQTSLLKHPVAVVANCTSNGTLSLLLSLPNNENDPATATNCDQVVGSFDPNDKVGFPQGLGPEHYLEKGQDIDYRIRFQNTGNDTAFLIRVVDTLPATLDPISIRPLAASHPYTWDLSDAGILTFTFANILLPDSNTNELASHGFVTFRISQKPGLSDGSLIRNNASIYFDFNEGVQTNTWHHTIGRPITVGTKNPDIHSATLIKISPNPVQEEAVFTLEGYTHGGRIHFSLLDPTGRTRREEDFSGTDYRFHRNGLPAGIYFWQMSSPDGAFATGKITLQ